MTYFVDAQSQFLHHFSSKTTTFAELKIPIVIAVFKILIVNDMIVSVNPLGKVNLSRYRSVQSEGLIITDKDNMKVPLSHIYEHVGILYPVYILPENTQINLTEYLCKEAYLLRILLS